MWSRWPYKLSFLMVLWWGQVVMRGPIPSRICKIGTRCTSPCSTWLRTEAALRSGASCSRHTLQRGSIRHSGARFRARMIDVTGRIDLKSTSPSLTDIPSLPLLSFSGSSDMLLPRVAWRPSEPGSDLDAGYDEEVPKAARSSR
jgi:hypothetical protein